jgi:hypothetical protein
VKKHPEGLLYGFLLGHLFSTILTIGLVYFLSFSWLTLVLHPLLTLGWVLISLRNLPLNQDKKISVRPWEKGDYLVLLIGLLIYLVLVVPPLTNMGRETPSGYAFHGSFNADSLRNMAFIAELSKGEMPPINPYFSGEPLHYYWLYFVAPAAIYKILGKGVSVQSLLTWHVLFAGVFFLAAFFSTLRLYTRRIFFLGVGLFLILLANNYKGFYLWWTFPGSTWEFFDQLLNTAVEASGLLYWRVAIWGIFSYMLVAPQHLFALALFLMGWTFYVNDECRMQNDERVHRSSPILHHSLLVSFIMSASFGYSGFVGLIAILWYGSSLLISVFKDKRALGKNLVRFLVSMGGLSLPLLAFYALEIAVPGRGELSFYINETFLANPFRIFFLNLGPGFVLGTLGMIAALWALKNRSERMDQPSLRPNIWLMIICLLVFITVNIRKEWEVTSKSGMILAINLVFFSVRFLDTLYTWLIKNKGLKTTKDELRFSSTPRRLSFIFQHSLFIIFLVLLCLPAVPTVLMHAYTYTWSTDLGNTRFINRKDMKALTWIRDNLPEESLIVDVPFGFNEDDKKIVYAKIPSFAERRTALGDRLDTENAQIPWEWITSRRRDIDSFFETPDLAKAMEIARRLGIQYAYVGPTEKAYYPFGLSKFGDFGNLFRRVYNQDFVQIFQILDGEPERVVLHPTPLEKTSYQAKEVVKARVTLQNQNYNDPVQVELAFQWPRVPEPSSVDANVERLIANNEQSVTSVALGPGEEKTVVWMTQAPDQPGVYQAEITGRVVLDEKDQIVKAVFQSEDLRHDTGQNIPDPEDSTGVSRVGFGQRRSGFLTYGPDIELQAGDYLALFRLKGKDFKPEEQVVTLEVTAAKGVDSLAKKNLFGKDFIALGSFEEFEIPFVLDESSNIKFRTYFHGAQGELFVDHITIIANKASLERRNRIERISFQSENLRYSIGQDRIDPDDSTGVSRVSSGQCINGFLTYGPYVELPRGSYLALFKLKGKGFQSEEQIANLEVTADNGHALLARKKLFAKDFAIPGSFQEFELPFTLNSANKVEFRTYFQGASGELFVDHITVTPGKTSSEGKSWIERVSFQSEDLPHDTGYDIKDSNDSTGVSRVSLGKPVGGFLTYGPYKELPAGSYLVSFRLKGKDLQSGEQIATLDVTADNGRKLLADKKLFGEDFTLSGTFQEFKFPFTLDTASKVEFRTYFHGHQGELFVDNIHVEQNLLISKGLGSAIIVGISEK